MGTIKSKCQGALTKFEETYKQILNFEFIHIFKPVADNRFNPIRIWEIAVEQIYPISISMVTLLFMSNYVKMR